MSAASFLGIAGIVSTKGYDGLIYSVGWLVGWPIIMFLIAEPLRNLGKYTFSDVVAFRLKRAPDPRRGGHRRLLTVIFYLIAQMVGAGTLFRLMFGLPFEVAARRSSAADDLLRALRRHDRDDLGADHQGLLLLGGATLLVILVALQLRLQLRRALRQGRRDVQGQKVLEPGGLYTNPLDTFSLALALMFGTAGLPHILMRFYTVPDAKAARKSVLYATGFIGYFYCITVTIGFGAMALILGSIKTSPASTRAATWRPRCSPRSSAAASSSASSRPSRSRRSSRSSPA